MSLDCIPAKFWLTINILRLLMCLNFLCKLCSQNKRFSQTKSNFSQPNKDKIEFLASFFNEYFVMLRKEFGHDVKQHIFLSVRCLISDFMFEITSFRVSCHIFHCKRGFNVVYSCQYCPRFFVDSVRLSNFIQKELSLKKTDFDPDIVA